MFKVGDRVRYTGAYKNSYRYAPGWAACTDMTIVDATIHRTQRENSVVYVAGSIGRHEAVYAGDCLAINKDGINLFRTQQLIDMSSMGGGSNAL